MLTTQAAQTFARDWYAAWNAHDLERIVAHYRDDVRFSSPLVPRILAQRVPGVIGRSALAAYFRRGLDAYPDLRFEPLTLLVGAESVLLHYRSVGGTITAEAMVLDREMRVWRATAHYDQLP